MYLVKFNVRILGAAIFDHYLSLSSADYNHMVQDGVGMKPCRDLKS